MVHMFGLRELSLHQGTVRHRTDARGMFSAIASRITLIVKDTTLLSISAEYAANPRYTRSNKISHL